MLISYRYYTAKVNCHVEKWIIPYVRLVNFYLLKLKISNDIAGLEFNRCLHLLKTLVTSCTSAKTSKFKLLLVTNTLELSVHMKSRNVRIPLLLQLTSCSVFQQAHIIDSFGVQFYIHFRLKLQKVFLLSQTSSFKCLFRE